MIPTPLHPAIVHFPLVLAFVLPIFAVATLWAIARTRATRFWVVPFALSIMLFVSAFIALRTGQQEEEKVEHTVSERVLNEHEEAAETFLIAAGILTLITAAGLMRGKVGGGARVAATIGAAAMILLAFNVGKAGGELVYKHGAAQAYLGAAGAAGDAATTLPADAKDDD